MKLENLHIVTLTSVGPHAHSEKLYNSVPGYTPQIQSPHHRHRVHTTDTESTPQVQSPHHRYRVHTTDTESTPQVQSPHYRYRVHTTDIESTPQIQSPHHRHRAHTTGTESTPQAQRPQHPHLHVSTMVFSASHVGLSAMILAWRVTSCGESWGSSLGCVWIHPNGSISLRYSWAGSCWGKWTVWKSKNVSDYAPISIVGHVSCVHVLSVHACVVVCTWMHCCVHMHALLCACVAMCCVVGSSPDVFPTVVPWQRSESP